ncbi:MAG: ATP-binding protein, partial [Polyangiaceae bacterium]|nr:ATP-binding protein [Polyangiaceae bacterium]
GLYHFWLFLRRKTSLDLQFFLLCLNIALYNIFAVGLYHSQNIEEGSWWQRLQLSSITLSGFFLLRFLHHYVNVRPPRIVRVAIYLFPVGSVICLFERSGLFLNNERIVRVAHSWLGSLTYYEYGLGPLGQLMALLVPVLSIYLIWLARASIKENKSTEIDDWHTLGPPQNHAPLLLTASGLLLLGIMHDMFVLGGLVDGIYLAEYSWSGVLLLMSWSLTDQVLDASNTKRALAASEDRIATTLDAITDAVITTNRSGLILHLNPAAEKLLGIHLQDTRDKPLTQYIELTLTDGHQIVEDPVDYAIGRPANPFGHLPQLVTSQGAEYRIDIGGVPLCDAQGRVQGAVIVIRDLTVQQEAIESLEHAKKMEATGQLAGGVAHDLNNLLTPILSYVELSLRQLDPTSPVSRYLTRVQEASVRASSLTQELLALSRKQVLDVQVLPLGEFILQLAPVLERLLPDNVQLDIKIDDQGGRLKVDPGQLEQVLMNLVSNARDAMPQGGQIRVITSKLTDGHLQLEVRDQGEGIAPELQTKVFEPFFTTKPRGKGTGLGLASVRGIVEQHGGRIYIDSEPGEGSSFSVVLAAADEKASPRSSERSSHHDITEGQETLLVVEDDPAVRTLLNDSLSLLGYRVLCA